MRKTSLSFIDSFERNIEEQFFFCLRLFYLEITWAKPQVSYPMTSPDYRTLSSGVLLVRRSSLILALLHNIVSNYSSEPGRVGCACFWLRQKWLFSYEHCYWLGLFKVCFDACECWYTQSCWAVIQVSFYLKVINYFNISTFILVIAFVNTACFRRNTEPNYVMCPSGIYFHFLIR